MAVLITVGAVMYIPPGTPGSSLDKPVHLCEYLLLAWCTAQAARASRWPLRQIASLAVIGPVAYGVLLEAVQSVLPYRSAEWLDVLSNTIGAMVGTLIALASIVSRDQQESGEHASSLERDRR